MEKSFHRFSDLFNQLGLASDQASIQEFIDKHAPLPEPVLLENAFFWSESQATFLREQLLMDADWAELIDQLSKDLR